MDIFDLSINWLKRQKALGKNRLLITDKNLSLLQEVLDFSKTVTDNTAHLIDETPVLETQNICDNQTINPLPIQTSADISKIPPIINSCESSKSENIQESIKNCSNFSIAVNGNLHSNILFIGEDFLTMENQPPFFSSQKLLKKMIQSMNLSWENTARVSILKSSNAFFNPDLNMIKTQLDDIISKIKPKIIVLMSALPILTLININDSIHNIHGTWHFYNGISCLPTFHPFYLISNPNLKRLAWTDLQQIMHQIRRTQS